MQRNGHPDACDCQSCMALVMAARATNPDGSPFFTEAELQQLADIAATEPGGDRAA